MKPNTLGGIALVVAVISLVLNGYLLYDRSRIEKEETLVALNASFDFLMDSYCADTTKSSEEELVALATDLPGAEEAKIETEDGKKMLVVGYKPAGADWGDIRAALDCSNQ